MKRFRRGLVCKAHRLWYHSSLCSRVKKKKRNTPRQPAPEYRNFGFRISARVSGCSGIGVSELGPLLLRFWSSALLEHRCCPTYVFFAVTSSAEIDLSKGVFKVVLQKFPHKSVNIFFMLVIVKDTLRDFWGMDFCKATLKTLFVR